MRLQTSVAFLVQSCCYLLLKFINDKYYKIVAMKKIIKIRDIYLQLIEKYTIIPMYVLNVIIIFKKFCRGLYVL